MKTQLVAAIVFLGVFIHKTEAVQYRFTVVADSSTYRGFRAPSINNAGEMACLGGLYTPTNGIGIVVANGSGVAVIPGSSSIYNLVDPVIRDDGAIYFMGQQPSDSHKSVLLWKQGAMSTVAQPTSPFYDFFSCSGNSNGEAVFFADMSMNRGIFKWNSAGTDLIVDTTGEFMNFSDPKINDSGTIAFLGTLRTDASHGYTGLYTIKNGEVSTAVSVGASFVDLGNFAINDLGTVAFTATSSQMDYGVYTKDSLGLRKIADSRGPFKEFGYYVSINDRNQVAFTATLDSGVKGIFTGPNPITDKIIAVGDAVAGSVVTSIDFSGAFNDSGQIGFTSWLKDGRFVLFRGDPVPEPALVLPFSFLLFGTTLRRRRRAFMMTLHERA